MASGRRQGYLPSQSRKKVRETHHPPNFAPVLILKQIILCFDGTGNKFQGTDADSNILKIYRMLDRGNGDRHYYQVSGAPGIGTYVNTRSLSHTSLPARFSSWYQKAKDSAVGTSFDEHVMGAYKFLMQAYNFEDDLYFFGFSRGAYVARFLAEMLDHVGLLSAGNEELARFAWKAFSQWQERQEGTDEEKQKKAQIVPRFENAWMQRSKFPYTARSSAKVIRHAVSIDERRAKFRQDLISETRMSKDHEHRRHHHHRKQAQTNGSSTTEHNRDGLPTPQASDRFRRPSQVRAMGERSPRARSPHLSAQDDQGHLMPSLGSTVRLASQERPQYRSVGSESHTIAADQDACSIHSVVSQGSMIPSLVQPDDEEDEDEAAAQNIEEVWFPGCHADLGGGWPLASGEEVPLSHGPLVWMVREAQKAGLEFDQGKMRALRCCEDQSDWVNAASKANKPPIPEVQVTRPTDLFRSPHSDQAQSGWAPGLEPEPRPPSKFHKHLHTAATQGTLHDCLEFNNGLSRASVLSWKLMEYLPFRRMDLRPDGSWQAISLPLPMGEVRDIPEGAWIHNSALRRMEFDENYRPGNLIIGGGGRGVKKAPKELGTGNWEVLKESGDPVGEVFVRKGNSLDAKMG
ncbi:MAG: hypothetical protein Q9191_000437 [Dirinaria sp. TL-2023a]